MKYEIFNSLGEVENSVIATEEFMANAYPDGNYRKVAEKAPPEVAKQYSPLDFRALFTFPELVTFDNSALPYVVTIRENFRAAQYIDLDDPRTVAQVQLLATADCGNILSPERMAQVQAGEKPS